jgi:hypothetical protein
MKLRAALDLVLSGSLLLLASLAYASPTDPIWIPGVYDDADFDQIVDFIIAESGVLDLLGAQGLRPAGELVVITVVGSDQDPALDPPPSSDAIRAPPAS